MRFHRSNFGRYGDSLPTDSNGYVSCSGPAANKVRDYALKHGVAAARERYEGSVSASSLAVGLAEARLEEWRSRN
jgi:hypothetical protein